jgi:parvulin-like peptidyl-prolyl isomerase
VSAAKGGDLGSFKRGQMMPAFEEAVFKMKPGELSEPVKSPLGYHIIKLESRSAGKTFEEARADMEKRMRPEAAQKAMEELLKNSAATLDPDFFGLAKQ